MAALTQTLKTQVVNVFGPSPPTTWGATGPWKTMVWGTSTWGMKSAGVAGAPALILSIFKTWTKTNEILPTNTTANLTKNINKTLLSTFLVAYTNTDKELFSGNGYNYVFPDRVTNIESAVTQSYSSAAAASTTYTSLAVQTTTWS